MIVPFNVPNTPASSMKAISDVLSTGQISGNGPVGHRVEQLLAGLHRGRPCRLTTSCTHALEMAALLLDLRPGDEVIVPSFTFVSTAQAFALHGATLRFVDSCPITLNIDFEQAKRAITPKTRALVIVHYAGMPAEPVRFRNLCDAHGIVLIEDNAHGLGGAFRGQPLGTFGHLSTLSFHATKNVSCGEGGALVIESSHHLDRAEILREKGTDRTKFLHGAVDKYTWVDSGSSWILSDILAALLEPALQDFSITQQRRHVLWNRYYDRLRAWADGHDVQIPNVQEDAHHSAHMFYLIFPEPKLRQVFVEAMEKAHISTPFHYSALNVSPIGRKLGGEDGQCPVAESVSERLVRLPLFSALTDEQQDYVISRILAFS